MTELYCSGTVTVTELNYPETETVVVRVAVALTELYYSETELNYAEIRTVLVTVTAAVTELHCTLIGAGTVTDRN